ncbi:MAG: hypothetical protein ACYCO0_02795 [Candidatus Micrarchaeaceae archaeon]
MATKLVQLQKEVETMKQELQEMKKAQSRPVIEQIIIEKIGEGNLTPKERKHLKEARADIKAGRMNKFVTLKEFESSLRKRKKLAS